MIVGVLVELSNRNIDKVFDYHVPYYLEEKIKVGVRVTVPFHNQTLEGFIIEIKNEEEGYKEVKDIIKVVDEEVILNNELLSLGKYIQDTTLCTQISAYQAMLPKALKAQHKTDIKKKMITCITLSTKSVLLKNNYNDTQKQILEIVEEREIIPKKELNLISSSSVKTLLKKGVLKEVEKENYLFLDSVYEIEKKHPLTFDQERVVNKVLTDEVVPKTYLLHGVTGSGKTEVYMELIEHYLKLGKTSIVLVPEISLTPQMVNRFQKRFGSSIAILHSRLNETEKYDEYRRIVREEAKIVIGARSAIFAPLKNIGIIIIDEEHTSTYKQENNPKYSAIDIAIKRSEHHNAKVVLGSATPSLETYSKALVKKYELLELKTRVFERKMPIVTIVDMGKEKKKDGYFSNILKTKIKEKLEKNEQIILLLNRRGYASFITCTSCGYVAKCPNCDISLTYHKTSDMCRCHYCGYATKRITTCPDCKENNVSNLGVGTEKVEEELNKLFSARVIRMDVDTTNTKGAHERIINDFKEQKYDILLGTQMIAKGLDFANVTLVGVINADTSLMIPNYKSSETTFQLLNQVSGRSGRGEKEGEVIIQTFNPDHYAILCAKNNDYKGFFQTEMNLRKELKYSPYYYLVSLKIISKDYEEAKKESTKIASYLKEKLTSSIVLGPSVSSIFKVKNTYRFGIMIKYKKEENLYKTLKSLLNHYSSSSKVVVDIDFNPNVI